MKEKYIKIYMKMAIFVASLSHYNRRKVGTIIVTKNDTIVMGYNGMPSGWDNSCEDCNNTTKDEVIHAESNAISKLSKSNESANGASMFVTLLPCIECAKLIKQSGIKTVYYMEDYRNDAGKVFLEKCGVTVEKYASYK